MIYIPNWQSFCNIYYPGLFLCSLQFSETWEIHFEPIRNVDPCGVAHGLSILGLDYDACSMFIRM